MTNTQSKQKKTKQISLPVTKRLFALSGNQCAFPECQKQMVDENDTVRCEMCHIEGSKGPRYNPQQTVEQRNSFDNLILLCRDHHTTIDRHEDTYTVETLKKMKQEHEQRFVDNPYQVSDRVVAEMTKRLENLENKIESLEKDTKSMCHELFEKNFVRLQGVAENIARKNIENFTNNFWQILNLFSATKEEIEKFSDPDEQYNLSKAIRIAACKGDETTNNLLSRILLKRIKENDDLQQIFCNQAIEKVEWLTVNELKVITLRFFMYEYLWKRKIVSWEELNNYFTQYVQPFFDCNRNGMIFRHLEACNCWSKSEKRNRLAYHLILPQPLFGNCNHMDKQQEIFEEHSDFAVNLGKIWIDEDLRMLDLTPVGITLVTSFYGAYLDDRMKDVELLSLNL